jgi:hypothetical protein
MSSLLVTLARLYLVCVLGSGKAVLGHVFHVGEPDMILSSPGVGPREKMLSGHVFHVGDPDMIISYLCAVPRQSALGHLFQVGVP